MSSYTKYFVMTGFTIYVFFLHKEKLYYSSIKWYLENVLLHRLTYLTEKKFYSSVFILYLGIFHIKKNNIKWKVSPGEYREGPDSIFGVITNCPPCVDLFLILVNSTVVILFVDICDGRLRHSLIFIIFSLYPYVLSFETKRILILFAQFLMLQLLLSKYIYF